MSGDKPPTGVNSSDSLLQTLHGKVRDLQSLIQANNEGLLSKAEEAPPRMLRIEVHGKMHDWFDLGDMGDSVKTPAFVDALQKNIERYFSVPEESQAIFDEDGLLTSDVDYYRAFERLSPLIRVYDIAEMDAGLRQRTVEKLACITAEAQQALQRIGRASGRDAPAAASRSSSQGGREKRAPAKLRGRSAQGAGDQVSVPVEAVAGADGRVATPAQPVPLSGGRASMGNGGTGGVAQRMTSAPPLPGFGGPGLVYHAQPWAWAATPGVPAGEPPPAAAAAAASAATPQLGGAAPQQQQHLVQQALSLTAGVGHGMQPGHYPGLRPSTQSPQRRQPGRFDQLPVLPSQLGAVGIMTPPPPPVGQGAGPFTARGQAQLPADGAMGAGLTARAAMMAEARAALMGDQGLRYRFLPGAEVAKGQAV